MPAVMRVFLLLWIAMVGGCVGSFLNVVVYRLPRGQNLAHPRSACPRCGHAIRAWHNIPVFGWLMLRGRCYDCRAPIAARYPLVEAAVMCVFALLAYLGPLADVNPANPPIHPVAALPLASQWIVFGYQVTFVCVLLAFSLIEGDGNPDGKVAYPNAMFVFGLTFALSAPMIEPHVHPFPIRGIVATTQFPFVDSAEAFADAAAGVLAGLLLGFASRPSWRIGPMGELGGRFALGNAVLSGAVLGVSRAATLLVASALCSLVIGLAARRRLRMRRLNPSLFLAPYATILLAADFVRTDMRSAPEQSLVNATIAAALAAVLILLASLTLRAIARRTA
ncbi:MAG: prepilin peptidase [Planctomycetales bacterium]|nr:prepilin peptidase [Planctomycetales bacterium]